MKNLLSSLFLVLLCSVLLTPFARAECTIEDDEEYAVFAAVLFPNEPDVPDRIKDPLRREAYLALASPRLEGFQGSSYRIRNETITDEGDKRSREFIEIDFRKKNGEACRIDAARLRPHLPSDALVSLVDAREARGATAPQLGNGREEGLPTKSLFDGMTYLSRPGFNEKRTEATVEAHHQAAPEMGVGYRVYLAKSTKTGKWFITSVRKTRMS
jgi:hypothetical protein